MGRPPLHFVLVTLVLAMGLAAFAVAVVRYWPDGGSGSASEQEREYFLQLETAEVSFNRAIQELMVELEAVASPDLGAQEQVQLAHDFSIAIFSEYDRYAERIENLQPPKSVSRAHDKYVSATQEFVQLWSDVLADDDGSQRLSSIVDVLRSDRFLEIGHDYDEACMNLRGEARRRDVNIYLAC